MADAWDDRKKALENEYFHREEQKLLDKMKQNAEDTRAQVQCQNRCPKCGELLEPLLFRDVPLDHCRFCGGVWLGPNDLKILAAKDHRTWFDHWFGQEEKKSIKEEC